MKPMPPMEFYREYCKAMPYLGCRQYMCDRRNYWCLAVTTMDAFKRKLIEIKIKRLQEKQKNG
jgi:hypothetical protein